MACPSCTLINPINSKTCSMCATPIERQGNSGDENSDADPFLLGLSRTARVQNTLQTFFEKVKTNKRLSRIFDKVVLGDFGIIFPPNKRKIFEELDEFLHSCRMNSYAPRPATVQTSWQGYGYINIFYFSFIYFSAYFFFLFSVIFIGYANTFFEIVMWCRD